MTVMTWITRRLRRRWHRYLRRGFSSRRYMLAAIRSATTALTLPNAVYGWLIMTGMIEHVERLPGTHLTEAHVPWSVHPRNVMDEATADQFLGAFAIIQRIDRSLMRNVGRYARLLGLQYMGHTLTVDEVMAIVGTVVREE